MKKILAIVGLFLGLMAVKAEASNFYSTVSTGVLVSSGVSGFDQYNITAVRLSTANAQFSGNTVPYVILLATNSAGGCTANWEVGKAITPPIYFSSGTFSPSGADLSGIPYFQYNFPGAGITVGNPGLVICQPLGNANGVTGGMVTIYTAPAPTRRSEVEGFGY